MPASPSRLAVPAPNHSGTNKTNKTNKISNKSRSTNQSRSKSRSASGSVHHSPSKRKRPPKVPPSSAAGISTNVTTTPTNNNVSNVKLSNDDSNIINHKTNNNTVKIGGVSIGAGKKNEKIVSKIGDESSSESVVQQTPNSNKQVEFTNPSPRDQSTGGEVFDLSHLTR